MSRRGALLAGALLALTVGWPVGEGVWALTWPAAVRDGVAPQNDAARRLLARHREVVDETFHGGGEYLHAHDLDCLEQLESRSLSNSNRFLESDLASAIRAFTATMDRGEVELVAQEALVKLPHPVLGALDGCVAASLLAPMCGAWAADRMRTALAAAQPRLAKAREANLAYARKLGCRALHHATTAPG